jgi:ketosteroid isomerase-like protein
MANVTVVQAFITAFGSGDAETALGQLHDDVQVSEPASRPIGGEYAGKAAFVGFLAKVAATYQLYTRRWQQDHLHQRLPGGHQGPPRAHRRQRDATSVIGQPR